MANKVLSEPIAILGAGVAGLIDAYVLLQDGFTNVTVITRDRSVGGTWSRDRVYPGLCINKYVLLHHSRGAINSHVEVSMGNTASRRSRWPRRWTEKKQEDTSPEWACVNTWKASTKNS